MAVELGDDIEGLARLSYTIAFVVQVGYLLAFGSVGVYVLLEFGLLAGLATMGGIYIVGSLPVLAVTTESVYVTDDDPDTVRDDFGRLGSPAATYWVVWADDIEEAAAEHGRRYELRQSSLGLVDRRIHVLVEKSSATSVTITAGDGDQATATTVVVEAGEERTTVRVRSSVDPARPRHLLTMVLQSPVERRLWRKAGYHYRNGGIDVGI